MRKDLNKSYTDEGIELCGCIGHKISLGMVIGFKELSKILTCLWPEHNQEDVTRLWEIYLREKGYAKDLLRLVYRRV